MSECLHVKAICVQTRVTHHNRQRRPHSRTITHSSVPKELPIISHSFRSDIEFWEKIVLKTKTKNSKSNLVSQTTQKVKRQKMHAHNFVSWLFYCLLHSIRNDSRLAIRLIYCPNISTKCKQYFRCFSLLFRSILFSFTTM